MTLENNPVIAQMLICIAWCLTGEVVMSRQTVHLLFLFYVTSTSVGCIGGLASTAVFDRLVPFRGIGEGGNSELSEEFRAAKRQFGGRTQSVMLSYAALQESQQNYSEALEKYREISIAYPNSVDAHLGMARIEELTGRFVQAEEILAALSDRSDELDSDESRQRVFLARGRLYSERSDWSEAITAFESACQVNESNQECRYELGLALIKSGQVDKGLGHLTFSVGSPAAHYNIAWILHQRSQDEEAVLWLQKAMQQPDRQTAEKSAQLLAEIRRQNPRFGGMAENSTAGFQEPIQQVGVHGSLVGASSPLRPAVATDLDTTPVTNADFYRVLP